MRVFKQNLHIYIRVSLIAVLLWGVGAAFLLLPSSRVSAAEVPRCFNVFAGSVPYPCPDSHNDGIKVDGVVNGAFVAGKCYRLADTSVGWQSVDCQSEPFKSTPVAGPPPIQSATDSAASCTSSATSCDIVKTIVNPLIDFLSATVGLIVTVSIVMGGIQYASSADDPKKIADAKARIINSVLALIGFAFLWAFLQWLLPGGALN